MANKQVPFFRGTTTYLNTISNVDGQVLFNTTTKKIYMDDGTNRVEYSGTVDTALSTTSTNPVQNKVITGKLGTDTLTTTATTCTGAINELNTKIISADSYATCSTARSTAAKVVSLTGFSLKTGSTIKVRFTDTGSSNPASGNLTLNVNSTGAKTIVDGHTNNTTMTYANAGYFYNNMVCDFVYNGTSWVWLNRDTNTTYTGATMKTSVAKTGSGSTVTNTIATSTSLDNVVGTLLNNDYALNTHLFNVIPSSNVIDTRTPMMAYKQANTLHIVVNGTAINGTDYVVTPGLYKVFHFAVNPLGLTEGQEKPLGYCCGTDVITSNVSQVDISAVYTGGNTYIVSKLQTHWLSFHFVIAI
jgi:hypothetical protein